MTQRDRETDETPDVKRESHMSRYCASIRLAGRQDPPRTGQLPPTIVGVPRRTRRRPRISAVQLTLALLLLAGALIALQTASRIWANPLDGHGVPAHKVTPGSTAVAAPSPTGTPDSSGAVPAIPATGTPTTAVTPAVPTGTSTPGAQPLTATITGTTVLGAAASLTITPTEAGATPAGHIAAKASPAATQGWRFRSVDTMKLSRDTLKTPLTDTQIAAIVRLDARMHLTHITVDVYYDDPAYMARWVRAIRAVGLHVWFRSHWYAWEDHHDRMADMTPHQYIAATRRYLQTYSGLLRNGDIFDFCPEPENGAYWLNRYGNGWSWRNRAAKTAFNTFLRSGVYVAQSTLSNRGLGGVTVTVISVSDSIAERMLSKPTVQRLGRITLDLYPEGKTRDPATATRRLISQIQQVHRRWSVPIVVGEHGYARDLQVDDATQARVLAAELAGLARLPYVQGLNYWVDAGGPGYGGYTNLYGKVKGAWTSRAAAAVLARAYGGTGGISGAG